MAGSFGLATRPLMFRLIRTILLIGVAFVVGVFYERNNVHTVCLEGGGNWERGVCYGLEAANG